MLKQPLRKRKGEKHLSCIVIGLVKHTTKNILMMIVRLRVRVRVRVRLKTTTLQTKISIKYKWTLLKNCSKK